MPSESDLTSIDAVQQVDKAAPGPLVVRSGWLKLLVSWRLLALVCLFQLGVLTGVISLWSRAPTPTNDSGVVKPPAGSVKGFDSSSAGNVAGDLSQADTFLRQANYESALTSLRSLAGDSNTSKDAAIYYRIALCLEALGKPQEALSAYHQAGLLGTGTIVADSCQVGQARIYLAMDQPTEAIALLSHLVLRSGQDRLRDRPLIGDARYLLAYGLALEALPTDSWSLATPKRPRAMPSGSVERSLAWVASKSEAPPRIEPQHESVRVHKIGPKPDDSLCSACALDQPVEQIVQRIAEAAGVKLTWTTLAKQQVAARSVSLDVEDAPVTSLLSTILYPLNLLCLANRDGLSLEAEQEVRTEVLSDYRLLSARRAFREALLCQPNHPLAPTAWLELGNLELGANPQEAITWYERILREASGSREKPGACYNLGLARRRLGHELKAEQAFYHAVDQIHGHELAPLAYLQIGQIRLEAHEFARSIRPLRRAVSASVGTPVRALCALALATAYLLTDNPRAANAALVESREQVSEQRYRAAAGFLDSFARYRAAVNPKNSRREASDLITALLAVRNDRLLGPAFDLLRGQACRDLGLDEQMAACYEEALGRTTGPIASDMALSLAEAYQASGDHQRADRFLRTLVKNRDPRWAPRAQRHLAEIALQHDQPKECLNWCRQLLANPDTAERALAIQTMGRAFEKLGDYERAAQCFAGRAPD